MIMSSRKLDRNDLFPRRMIKNRQLQRRCLNGRRNISHESKGTLPSGDNAEGARESNDDQGGIGDGGGKLPARAADI